MSGAVGAPGGVPAGRSRATGRPGPLLAIDAGSPRVSVAVGDGDRVLAEAMERRERSSAALLAMIDEILRDAGLRPGDLAGVVALRGPGSFTGLRVGLATALGLHQALGVPAMGLPTLEILAGLGRGDGSTVVAAVDALRGEWFAQPFRSATPPRALAEPRLLPAAEIRSCIPDGAAGGAAMVVGFGIGEVADLAGAGFRAVEPPPLAGPAVRHAGRYPSTWDPATLVAPLYLRPPSARPSR